LKNAVDSAFFCLCNNANGAICFFIMKQRLLVRSLMFLSCLFCLPGAVLAQGQDAVCKVTGAVEEALTLQPSLPADFPVVTKLWKMPTATGEYAGSYEVKGVRIRDILTRARVAKKIDDGFNRPLDMYILVINESGKKRLFSYSEIFLGNQTDDILLVSQSRYLIPHKHPDLKAFNWKEDTWLSASTKDFALPPACMGCHDGKAAPSLSIPHGLMVAAVQDVWPGRFLDNVVEIRVCQVEPQKALSEKPSNKDNLWSENAEISFPASKTFSLAELIKSSLPTNKIKDCSFGEGKGFRGIHARSGKSLAQILSPQLFTLPEDSFYILVTALDGYRCLISGGELMLHKNPYNIMVVDSEDGESLKKGEGKYKIFFQDDFYIDRCIRLVKEIKLVVVN